MPQKSTITVKAQVRTTNAADFGAGVHDAAVGGVTLIDNGTAAFLADVAWSDEAVSIAASGQLLLDLAGGGLLDQLGQPANFAKVKAIIVKASPANVNDVILGGASSNAFVGPFGAATHTVAVKPGGTFSIEAAAAGWTVTAGTGDILRLANGGAGQAVVFDIVIIGTSA